MEKCENFRKLREECNSLCIYNDQQQTKISNLEEKINSQKADYDSFVAVYNDYVNAAELRIQNANLETEKAQKKLKQCETTISELQMRIEEAKKNCNACAQRSANVKSQNIGLLANGCLPHDGDMKQEICSVKRAKMVSVFVIIYGLVFEFIICKTNVCV